MQGLIIEKISNLYKVQTFGNISQKFEFSKNIEDTSPKIEFSKNIEDASQKLEDSKKTKKDSQKIENSKKTVYEATSRGKFKKDEVVPVVGDFVEFQVINEETKTAVIEKIINRKVYIKRPKLANLTQLILVVSSKNPKPDLLLLDKQLAFANYLGINAIIVLNKTDLDQNEEFKAIKSIYTKIGYEVLETAAKEGIGVEALKEKLKNNINAFAGNSGVGKSTLINAIFNKDMTQEGEISQKNKRGKNTTTAIKLYEIDENTFIADTPGFSTFDISEIESKDLYKCFKEFSDENCKYVGCTHIKEEECGIKQDVSLGKIDEGRYNRFCKIYNELKEGESRKW
ncbi:MAG: ribosome small subunit-dependent GTPase A [Clostridia bacterium]|nr:ribosome small subunit-dependent GTPase A [Clostridia bacterium]